MADQEKQPKKKKKKSGRLSTIIFFVILLVGAGLLAYPSFSNWWNQFHQSRAIAGYSEAVEDLSAEEKAAMLEEARAYNEQLAQGAQHLQLSAEERKRYNEVLDISGTGIMGYIDIPCIEVSLPIYHGTDEGALQIAIGHLEWTSLPIGGESTHAAVSGHRGLPRARLFTDLDQIVEGDTFMFHTLDEVVTYEVDQIRIVLPNEINDIMIEQGKDMATLVTCTPYGINSHRLLVRGHRVPNEEVAFSGNVNADAVQIDPMIVAMGAAVPLLLVLLWAMFGAQRRRARMKRNRELIEQWQKGQNEAKE